jgi:DNA repair protein RecN (Recombination protein N)
MITELRIDNFAIIEHLELAFTAGLVTFTGETGAGKSIIIDAVEIMLGGRAEAAMIRTGAERANVEAVFRVPDVVRPAVHAILEREGLLEENSEADADMVTLGREIRRAGRSIARVNGRSVSVGLLSELGEYLVDVHGQSEHLSLLRVRQHLALLDGFANVDAELTAYRATYHRLLAMRRELAELRQSESETARRSDILTYQINEIESARLRPGEEEELREERNRLANAEGLASLAQEALQALDEGTPESPAVTDLLGQVTHAMVALARIDPSRAALSEQAESVAESIADLIHELQRYHENIEFNPKRLDQVEERLNLINNLKRKYGKDIPAVLAFAEQSHKQLDAITHAGERIAELEADETLALEQLGREGTILSKKRHNAAEALSRAVEKELENLNMTAAHFRVDFLSRPDPQGVPLADNGQGVAFDINGLEHIEFFVALNPGEGFKPLVKTASGGETSRLMLAIKNVLARADQVPTLIFDEIDQGIGGRVGTVVGRKLSDLARQHQVLCVTHLPQLAAFGQQHYRVQKHVHAGRTTTQVDALQGEPRVLELAAMMGEVGEGTRQSALELLKLAASKA